MVNTGQQCSSSKPLYLQGLNDGNCLQFVNETHERYRTFQCRMYWWKYKYYHGEPPECLSNWCQFLAKCFNPTSDWETLCYEKFYRFRKSRFEISTATAEGVNVSYVKNIHVKHCEKIYGDWGTQNVTVKFAIKTSGYRCELGKLID